MFLGSDQELLIKTGFLVFNDFRYFVRSLRISISKSKSIHFPFSLKVFDDKTEIFSNVKTFPPQLPSLAEKGVISQV